MLSEIFMLYERCLVLRLWSLFLLLASVATIKAVFVLSLSDFLLLKVFWP